MKKHATAISVGLGALVLVWTAFWLSDSAKQPQPAPAPIEAPEPMPDEPSAAPNAELEAPAGDVAEPAAAPAQAPASAPSAAPDQRPYAQQRPDKMGPVEELKAAYERDARDPAAGDAEALIREQFKSEGVPAQLLRRVSCVKSACKLELSWRASDKQAYMIAMMNLVSHVSQKLAAEPIGDDEGQDAHPIDVYVSRVEPPYPGAPPN